MKDEDGGTFLGRWSRRKTAARAGRPLDEPLPDAARPDASREAPRPDPEVAAPAQRRPAHSAAPAGTPGEGAAPPELPAIDSLRGLASDYRDFLRPEVDEETRRAALKRLFADPHFNRMDGLDVYIDDYSQPDPIPAAMLRTLEHAKDMLFGDEPRRADAPDRHDAAPSGRSEAAGEAAAADHAALQENRMNPAVEAPGKDMSNPTGPNDPKCADLARGGGSPTESEPSG